MLLCPGLNFRQPGAFLIKNQIGLVGNDNLRTVFQINGILAQLAVDLFQIFNRVSAFTSGCIYNMQQQTAAVNMPQECMSQTGALGCAFNNTRNIRHHKGFTLTNADYTQIRHQCGKMIIGNLRPCRGCHGQQCGFTYIRKANQTYICQKLQFQTDFQLLSREARLGKTRSLTGWCSKMDITPAATATTRRNKRFRIRQVLNNLTGFGITQNGTAGYPDD